MSTKLDDAFATLRNLISDQTRDLALAMAELRNVAAERDNILETMQRNSVEYIAHHQARRAELDKLNSYLTGCNQHGKWAGVECIGCMEAERDKLRATHEAAAFVALRARQSLRAAEADLAETEGVNSDLRVVNRRLVADLAAATQRADTAEAILRAKA